jgi:hypothetical protein
MNTPQRRSKVIWLGQPTNRTHALTCRWALNVEAKESTPCGRAFLSRRSRRERLGTGIAEVDESLG